MALRAWDVAPEDAAPRLRLAQPPPRRPRVAPAAGFVVLLVGVLLTPVIRAATAPPEVVPWQEPRPLPAVAIDRIDRVAPVGGGGRPTSAEPVAGVAFVRCTRLWRAAPDGSDPVPVLRATGVSSPAFSPDGRTIAFARDGARGQELWLSAADGSEATRVGALRSAGDGLGARVGGLAWSPDGGSLAFAVTDHYGPDAGGSAIWTLELASGRFERVGGGWPAPFWTFGKLAFATIEEEELDLTSPDAGRGFARTLSSPDKDDVAAAVVPEGWSGNWRKGVAILRRTSSGTLELAIRNQYDRRDKNVVDPPAGYRFAPYSQPAIAQDASRVMIDLIDPGGGRDLGLYDRASDRWTIVDYAWEPAASPALPADGPPEARRARTVVSDLMWDYNDAAKAVLLDDPGDRALFRWRRIGFIMEPPRKIPNGWVVRVSAYGSDRERNWSYRQLDVAVRAQHHRLSADARPVADARPITTIADAHGFVEMALGRDVPAPVGLPAGATLARRPVEAYSWGDRFAAIRFKFPRPGGGGGGGGRGGRGMLTFAYGDRLGFNLGCGGVNDPTPTDVAGIPAMVDRVGRTRQVVWPATPKHLSGTLSIYGDLPKDQLVRIADAMEAQTGP